MSSTAGQAGTVNTTAGGDQSARAIGALAGGGYAIAWADGDRVAVQQYDANGVRTGAETAIHFDLGQHPDAALAVLSDGSVSVAYTSTRTVPGNPYPLEASSVLAHRFDASGAPMGGAYEVASLTHSAIAQEYKVAREPGFLTWPDGSHAVTWDVVTVRGAYGSGVSGAVASFDSSGEPVGPAAQLFGAGEPGSRVSFATLPDGGLLFAEQYVAGGQYLVRFTPSDDPERTTTIASTPDGSGLPGHSMLLGLRDGYALWSTAGEAPYLQLLDDTGAASGARVPLAHAPYQAQVLADGGFVLFWRVEGQDEAGADLVAQRFDAAGAAVGGEQRVETNGGEPLVTALAEGGWALAWTAAGADGSLDVFTQLFPDTGAASGDPVTPDGAAAQNAAASAQAATIHGAPGNDVLQGTAGDDTVDGGAGADTFVTAASLASVQGYAMAGGVVTLTTGSGTDTLLNVERVRLADSLFALDTHAPLGDAAGGHVWQAAALYRAAFGTLPGQADLSRWTAQADEAGDIGALAQRMVDGYARGASSADLVAHLYRTLVGITPDDATVQTLAGQFATAGDALACAATLSLNTEQMVGFTGSVQQLDGAWF